MVENASALATLLMFSGFKLTYAPGFWGRIDVELYEPTYLCCLSLMWSLRQTSHVGVVARELRAFSATSEARPYRTGVTTGVERHWAEPDGQNRTIFSFCSRRGKGTLADLHGSCRRPDSWPWKRKYCAMPMGRWHSYANANIVDQGFLV